MTYQPGEYDATTSNSGAAYVIFGGFLSTTGVASDVDTLGFVSRYVRNTVF
jgi:hypothetical protein